MPTIQIRNFPPHLYEKLKFSAKLSRRSLTQETIFLLEQGLNTSKKNVLEKKQKLWEENQKVSNPINVNLKEVVKWIREDRER